MNSISILRVGLCVAGLCGALLWRARKHAKVDAHGRAQCIDVIHKSCGKTLLHSSTHSPGASFSPRTHIQEERGGGELNNRSIASLAAFSSTATTPTGEHNTELWKRPWEKRTGTAHKTHSENNIVAAESLRATSTLHLARCMQAVRTLQGWSE